jgi:hypothetical protein
VSFGKAYDDSVFSLGTRGHQGAKHSAVIGASTAPTGTTKTVTTQPTQPTAQPAEPSKPGKVPAEPLKDVASKAPVAVANALTAMEQATAYCAANLTQNQLNLLGGLTACAQAYLGGGANAVTNLLDALGLGNLVGGLLPKQP